MTNNEAEYEALVVGSNLAKATEAENMVIYYNSQVIISQINGNYKCKNERMKKYLEEVKGQIGSLQIRFVQISREENDCADRLVKDALVEYMLILDQVLSFIQVSSLIDEGMNV